MSKESNSELILSTLKELDDENIVDIINIHTGYDKDLSSTIKSEVNSNPHWYLSSMTFNNLFCYADPITINFSSGATLISGAALSGKTSLLNVIIYGLYGELLHKNYQNINILNASKGNGYVELLLYHNSIPYSIKRTLIRQPNSKKNPIATNTELFFMRDNKKVSIKAEKAKKEIYDLFGTLYDFTNCNILTSKYQPVDFLNLINAEKIKYLKQIFKLGYFDELNDSVVSDKEELANRLTEKLSNLNGLDESSDIYINLKDEIKILESKKKNLDDYSRILNIKDTQLKIFKLKLCKMEDKLNDILKKYIKYTIKLEYENRDLKILLKYNDKILRVDSLSDYESIILSLVLKMFLHKKRSSGNLYIIDGILNLIDKDTTDKVIPDLLKLLINEYSNVFLVSHYGLTNITDNEIKIELKDNKSIINQYKKSEV